MEIYQVCFIGHREIQDWSTVEIAVEEILFRLILEKGLIQVYLGRSGDFDLLVASCIKRLQKQVGPEYLAMTLVLPYKISDMEYYEDYYNDIMIPEELQQYHYKQVITERNRWMLSNSDLLIAYVTKEKGGAYKCLMEARKRGTPVINFVEMESKQI